MSAPTLVLDAARRASAPPVTAPPATRLVQACILIGLIAVALPAVLVRIPPLLDLPNHYARIWLLAGGVHEAPLSHIYAVDWSKAWTNIGVDLAAQVLGLVIPGQALGPLFTLLALVLPPLGAIALHRSLYGGWRWWQAGIPLTAFATTLLAGFLNYQIGLGCALLAVAADPWLEKRLSLGQFMAARVAIAVGLLVVHIFALGFYACLLGGLALGPRLTALWSVKGARTAAIRVGLAAASVVVPLIAYRLTASAVPGGGELGPIWGPTTFKYKLDVLLCAFATYNEATDELFFGALLAVAVAAAAVWKLRVHQGLVLVAAGLAVIALLLPTWAAQTGWIDTRVPIMALLALIVALNPEMLPGRWPKVAAAAALTALVVARAAWIGGIWIERQADTASIDRALAHVPAGSAVLPVDHWPSFRGRREAPEGRYFHFGASFYHAYTLAVLDRRAFSPLVFSMTGKQPLKVLEPWKDISVPNGGRSPTTRALIHPTKAWLKIAPYIVHWRQRFDYALMLNADVLESADKDPLPDGMTLVADEGFARLYRIARPPPADDEDEPTTPAHDDLVRAKAPTAKPARLAART